MITYAKKDPKDKKEKKCFEDNEAVKSEKVKNAEKNNLKQPVGINIGVIGCRKRERIVMGNRPVATDIFAGF